MLFKNNPELLLHLKKLVVLQYHQISIQSVLKISNLSHKFHSFYTVWSLESKSDKVYMLWFLYMSQVFLTYGFPLDYFQKIVFFFLFFYFIFFLQLKKSCLLYQISHRLDFFLGPTFWLFLFSQKSVTSTNMWFWRILCSLKYNSIIFTAINIFTASSLVTGIKQIINTYLITA